MYSLVNSNFNRTYNPNGRQNALSDIKRLLTCRDTGAQSKACGYLIDVVSRGKNSEERERMIEYLLDNDITVFLCGATSNLDFTLFRAIISSLRLLWHSRRFFAEEHAAQAMSAVLRALAHFAGSGPAAAVDACMHFLCDLLNGISFHKTTPPLSHQSAYSAVQLLASLNSLATQIRTNQNSILSSALVLDALISYQPENLLIKGSTANDLLEVIKNWFNLLMGALNHSMLMGDSGTCSPGMLYVVTCQLGISSLSLTKRLYLGEQKVDFVQSILADEQETSTLKQCALDMASSILSVITDLVVCTQEHQNKIETEEYGVFLKFLLNFFYERGCADALPEFSDMLYTRGYLKMLPQVQIVRNDALVRKASTLVLGELLKVLASKYLNVDNSSALSTCADDIHMGLVQIQYGIEKPQCIGTQLQKGQPYSLLIYIYFYCQSTDNPEEATGPLLPFLVEHILMMPNAFRPPPYIIKALWLVFAMSSISNGSLTSLVERVYLEKATDRLVGMLQPELAVYYTHNPALLLWAHTSHRIPYHVRTHVISQWLKFEDTLPAELTTDPSMWEVLVDILVRSRDDTIVENCTHALYVSLDEADEEIRQEFSLMVWSSLRTVLSRALADDEHAMGSNICYLLELATSVLPLALDPNVCAEVAVLIAVMFSKDSEGRPTSGYQFEHVCLKMSLYLLYLANNQNDNRVLLTYVNRAAFLPRVLCAAGSADERVACAAVRLLSHVVHHFTRHGYQPKSVVQIQTNFIIQSLRRDSHSERGASLLQLVCTVLSSGVNTPLGLAYDVEEAPVVERQYNALRALMFRIQLMLCSRDSKNLSSAGWKTLSSIFKHAIGSKNDTNLVATLTSQPWTHILVQFQLEQQHIIPDFITFVHTWLTLLRITIKMAQERTRVHMSRHSLVFRTMALLKRHLKVEGLEGDLRVTGVKILEIVRDILRDSGMVEMFHDSGIAM